MNYEEFKNEFVDALQERLYESGNEVSINVSTVEKMNETYEAITITPVGSNIGMNLNLEVFAEAYENGVPFDEIVEQVTHKVEDHLSNMPTFDVQALTDYEQMKDKAKLKGCRSVQTGKTYDTTVVLTVGDGQRVQFSLSFEKGGK